MYLATDFLEFCVVVFQRMIQLVGYLKRHTGRLVLTHLLLSCHGRV